MEFVSSIVDFGGAPEIHINDVCRIEMISPNVVRVSYSAKRTLPDGKIENQVVAHLDWDKDGWTKMSERFVAAKAELLGADHETLFLKAPSLSH